MLVIPEGLVHDDLAGKVFVSTGCKRDYTMRTVIYGTKGTIICDNTSPTMTLFTVDENGDTQDPQTIEIELNNHNAVKEFEVFADEILNDKPVKTTAEEGAATVAVASAAFAKMGIIATTRQRTMSKPNSFFFKIFSS